MNDNVYADIRAMIERCIAECLKDPDMVNRSDDFKAGYAAGFREAIVAGIAAKVTKQP
jgi:hypothetical protein